MKNVSMVLLILGGVNLLASQPLDTTQEFTTGDLELKSMTALAFAPEGVLLVGDAIDATVYAVDLEDKTANPSKDRVEIQDIESKLGALMGVSPKDVLIHDMAVNTISQNIYLAVSRGRQKWKSRWSLPNDVANANLLLKITPKGDISEVSFKKVRYAKVSIPNPIAMDAMHQWKKTSQRVDAITDIAYHNGKVYVAGLSNEEFSSTLRVFPFPFKEQGSATALEIYHGAHGKWETQAPIRAFMPYSIENEDHILASYLCTPLVTFPLDTLEDKRKVRGKTIAELGYGNYPLDIVAFANKDSRYVLLANNNRGLMLFKHEDLEGQKEAIVEPSKSMTEGVPYQVLPMQSVLQLDYLNEENLLVMSRKPNGDLDLDSYPIGRL